MLRVQYFRGYMLSKYHTAEGVCKQPAMCRERAMLGGV
jgi:hypothetical protein